MNIIVHLSTDERKIAEIFAKHQNGAHLSRDELTTQVVGDLCGKNKVLCDILEPRNHFISAATLHILIGAGVARLVGEIEPNGNFIVEKLAPIRWEEDPIYFALVQEDSHFIHISKDFKTPGAKVIRVEFYTPTTLVMMYNVPCVVTFEHGRECCCTVNKNILTIFFDKCLQSTDPIILQKIDEQFEALIE